MTVSECSAVGAKGLLSHGISITSMSSDADYVDAEEWLEATPAVEQRKYTNEEIVQVFNEIDDLFNQPSGGGQLKQLDLYDKIKNIYNSDESMKSNVELLWRFARTCHAVANSMEKKDPKRKEIILEGRNYATAAYELDDNNFNVLKWAAVLTGCATDHVGMKEKIEQGFIFKMYLDKALEIDPSEYSLLHMRGRFAFSVANLSWIERKTASALFAAPPTATIEEALEDFLEAERLNPGVWLDNLLFIARCYLAKNDKNMAAKYLKLAVEIEPSDDTDMESIREARALLAKYS